MPIILPPDLPALQALREEGAAALPGGSAATARPLRIALVNLMPNKPATERHIARMLAASEHSVELTLVVPGSYQPTNTPREHLDRYYRTWPQVRGCRFDGVIITGAPVERLAFEDVAYWEEFCSILNWAVATARSTWCICWAGQAALYHLHGVGKHELPAKLTGVFRQQAEAADDPLLAGLPDLFPVPVSRHTEVRRQDLARVPCLRMLAASAESGPGLVRDIRNGVICNFNHPEYEADTLAQEYRRDLASGEAERPRYYFPADGITAPAAFWRPSAVILYRNWVEEVHRLRSAARPPSSAIDWLTRPVSCDAPPLAELRLALDEPGHGIARILEALDRNGILPHGIFTDPCRGGIFVVRMAPLGGLGPERLVQKLQAQLSARTVVYRTSDGLEGALATTGMAVAAIPTVTAEARTA